MGNRRGAFCCEGPYYMWRLVAGLLSGLMGNSHPPSILHVAFANLAAGYLVTLGVIALHALVNDAFDALAGRSPQITGAIRVTGYELASIGCVIMGILFVGLCKRHRLAWSHAFMERLFSAGPHANGFQVRVVTAYRMSVLGTAATIFLLFLERPHEDSMANSNIGIELEIFLVPLLVALGVFFSCHVLMLGPLCPRGSHR